MLQEVFGWRRTDPAPTTPINTTEFITIASTGNAQDFGDLTRTNNRHAAGASSTRGVFGGGDHASLIKIYHRFCYNINDR